MKRLLEDVKEMAERLVCCNCQYYGDESKNCSLIYENGKPSCIWRGLMDDLSEKRKLEDLMESYRIENQGRLEDLISAGLVYESISKDFGIGLDILFKALKDGVWYIDEDGTIKFAEVVLHSQFELELMIPYRYSSFYLIIKSYGKTWAITKEELE